MNADPQDLLLVRLLCRGITGACSVRFSKTAAKRSTDDHGLRADLVKIALEAGPDAAVGTAAEIATTLESMRSVEEAMIEGPYDSETLLLATEVLLARDTTRASFAARLYATLGRPDLAWSAAQLALQEDPSDPLARMAALRAAGMMEEPGLIAMVPSEPLDPQVESQRVRSLAEAGEFDTARVSADATVARFPGDPEVFEARGRLLSTSPVERGAAVMDLLRAIQLGRNDAGTWLEALLLATIDGDPVTESALRRARNFVTDAPDVDRLIEVQSAMNLGRLAQAEQILKELADNPKLRDVVMTNLLEVWNRQGRYDAARSWLLARMKKQPSVLTWQAALVWVDAQSGRLEDAIVTLRERAARRRSGHDGQLLEEALGFAGLLAERDEIRLKRIDLQPQGVGRELSLAELSLDEDPASAADRLRSVGAEYTTKAQWTRAIRIAEQLPAEFRVDVLAELAEDIIDGRVPLDAKVARVFFLHLPEEIRKSVLENAILVRPSWRISDNAWLENAGELAEEGEYSAAAELLEFRAVGGAGGDLPSASPLIRPLLGYALVAGWEPERIIEVFDVLRESGLDVAKGLDEESGSDNAWLVDAAQTSSMLGFENMAISLLEESVRRDRMTRSALNNLGFTLLVMDRNRPRAVKVVEEAHRISPGSASELDSLGWLRYKQGKHDPEDRDSAISYIEESVHRLRQIRRATVPVEVLLHYGDALWRAGRKVDAQKAWNEIIQMRGAPGTQEQMRELYGGWLVSNFGSHIVDPTDLWNHLEAQWLDAARERMGALARGEEPPLEPTWAELEVLPGGPASSP